MYFSLLSFSVFWVRSFEFFHDDLEDLVFLVSSISFDAYTLSAYSSTGLPELSWEGLGDNIPFRAESSRVSRSLCNGLYFCSHLLQEGISLIVNSWFKIKTNSSKSTHTGFLSHTHTNRHMHTSTYMFTLSLPPKNKVHFCVCGPICLLLLFFFSIVSKEFFPGLFRNIVWMDMSKDPFYLSVQLGSLSPCL